MDENEKQIKCDKLREEFEHVMLEEENKNRADHQIRMKKMKPILIIWR